MSVTVWRAPCYTEEGQRIEVTDGVPGDSVDVLKIKLAQDGYTLIEPVPLGHLFILPDSHDPVRPCGHGSAEYTRLDGWLREPKPSDIDYWSRPKHPDVTELERIHDL